MPPPKKPKTKASWDELMGLVEEDCASSEQSPAHSKAWSPFSNCSVSPQTTELNDWDSPEKSSAVMPEDLSMKSYVYQNGGQQMFNDSVQVISAESPEDKDLKVLTKVNIQKLNGSSLSKEHPQLCNILLGLSLTQVSHERLDNQPSAPRSLPRNSEPWGSPNVAQINPSSEEHLPRVAFSSYPLTGDSSDIISENNKTSWHIRTPGQVHVAGSNDTDYRQSSPVYFIHGTGTGEEPQMDVGLDTVINSEGNFQIGPNSRSYSQDSPPDKNKLGCFQNATSPTHRLNSDQLKCRRSVADIVSSKLPRLRQPLAQNTEYDSRVPVSSRENQLLKLFLEYSLPPEPLRNAHSEGKVDQISSNTDISVASPCVSKPYNPKKVVNGSCKKSLHAMMMDDHFHGVENAAPPSERTCVRADDDGGAARQMNGSSGMELWSLCGKLESQESDGPLEKTVTFGTDYHSSPELPSSSCPENGQSKMTDERGVCRCQICDDVASGFHYGVWSCEGCKAFFKRSLHGPVDYVCPATNNCTIDKLRRKSCQACRLRKCHEAGMTAGTSRKDKGTRPVGRKRKSAEEEPNNREASSPKNFKKVMQFDNVNSSNDLAQQQKSLPNGVSSETNHSPFSSSPGLSPNQRCAHPDGTKVPPLVGHLLAIELHPRLAEFDASLPDSKLQLLSGLLGLINCQLVDIITWSKALPDFSKSCLESRTRLLVSSWSELLILGTIWQSLPHPDTWVCAPNLHLTRDHCKLAMIDQLFVRIMHLVQTFRRLQLTQTELVLLRLTVLLNSDASVVESQPTLINLRSLLDETWQQTVPTDGLKLSRSRFSHLLLTLPDIRQCSLMMLDLINTIKHSDGIPVFELLHEMLETDYDFAGMQRTLSETTSIK